MQLQSKHDSATSFVDAGNAYKKADPQGKMLPCLGTWVCKVGVGDRHGFRAGPIRPGPFKKEVIVLWNNRDFANFKY